MWTMPAALEDCIPGKASMIPRRGVWRAVSPAGPDAVNMAIYISIYVCEYSFILYSMVLRSDSNIHINLYLRKMFVLLL